jgi:hypothetical protein
VAVKNINAEQVYPGSCFEETIELLPLKHVRSNKHIHQAINVLNQCKDSLLRKLEVIGFK